MTTSEKLLTGILAVLVLLVASVVALSVVIWTATRPAPAPTGPTQHLTVTAEVTNAIASAAFADATATSTLTLTPNSDTDFHTWTSDVAFGASVQVTVTVTTIVDIDYADESSDTRPPSATCDIKNGNTTLARAEATVLDGVAICSWTNKGQ